MNSKTKNIILLLLVVVIIILIPFFFKDKLDYAFKFLQPVSYLIYSDLVRLTNSHLEDRICKKLEKQLNKPYVVNQAVRHDLRPAKKKNSFIRLANWNIERGYKLDVLKSIFNSKGNYYYSYKRNLDPREHINLKHELDNLVSADILTLNEVDIGMPRTNYKNIPLELADSLGYNYAFATEFVELSPIIYKQNIDKNEYLGLHGNAILSRYPIKSTNVIRLPECYKWFDAESQKMSPLETARRVGAKAIFKEQILSEVRRGGRNALLANIELPNKEIVTVVSTHLEDRCYPSCRLKQTKFLLENLKSISNPVVLAGDFNTTTTDSAPTSFKKEFVKRIKDPHFIARQLAFAAIPGLPVAASFGSVALSKLIQYKDPTAPSIPVFLPNEERKLFNYLKEFRFSDGRAFDFSGDSKRSSNDKEGLLANSNERHFKGFESTFKFEEPRVVAYFKLDWFFVKPKGNKFIPFNGETLGLINDSFPGRISDHDPITVDLTL